MLFVSTMRVEDRLDIWAWGWRGPVLAAMVALLAGLPGLLALPLLDRDEARFAQASAQMLETSDFVSIHFQDEPRDKKPVGIYWLQAVAVAALGHVEDRNIVLWRVPSILGAMLAAGACAWGAAGFVPRGTALLAGALLGASFMLSTEADVAATDAVLCGAVTLMMAALGRLYLGTDIAGRALWLCKAFFWVGMALSILVKGPVGPMVAVLALFCLAIWDRKLAWMARLEWGWGVIFLLAVIGPWALAITVASDGAFWGKALTSDLLPKLVGAHEGHGAFPGYYLLLLPVLIFPATLLLPAAAVTAWRQRASPAARFALCWLLPSWFVFELMPTKLIHYTLPLYGALAWLMAWALTLPVSRAAQISGAGLTLVAAAIFALAGPLAMARLNDWSGLPWAVLVAGASLAAGAFGATLLLKSRAMAAIICASALAIVGHGALLGGLLPSLKPLWLSSRVAQALLAAGNSPRDGVTPGPVTVAGFEEPSFIFLLGTNTQFGDAESAALAIAQGRPAVVESRLEGRFQASLVQLGAQARSAGVVTGLDYANHQSLSLHLYAPQLVVRRKGALR